MPARRFAISSVAADGSSPFGMGGGVSVIMPLAQCARRPRLRRLQRQRRPQRASRIRGGCFCSGGSYGACAVMKLSVLTPMPPVPLGLLVPGGAGRLGLVRLSGCSYRSVSGQAEGGTGGGLRPGLVPGLVLPRRHPGVQDGRGCRVQKYRRARCPPMLRSFVFQRYCLFSLPEQKKERGA